MCNWINPADGERRYKESMLWVYISPPLYCTKVYLPCYKSLHLHGRHSKVDIKPPKGDFQIVTPKKNTVPWYLIPYNYIRGVHLCMISPLNWWSMFLECHLKNLLNIITHIIDVCANWKIMRYFRIYFRGYHITTHIELWISNYLQW